jgi:hypothetical protein
MFSLGLYWSVPSIFIDDKRNTTLNATVANDGTIDVVQLVLADRFNVYFNYYFYSSYFRHSQTECGSIKYEVSL